MAFLIFELCLVANVKYVLSALIVTGMALATLETFEAIGRYIFFASLYGLHFQGGQTLLLPFSILLMRIFSGQPAYKSNFAKLILMAVGILSPLQKPVVGAFLIEFLFVFILLSRQWANRSRQAMRIFYGVLFTFFIVWILIFVLGTGEETVRTNYLKEGATSQTDITGKRIEIWKLGFKVWRQEPILGHGLGYPIVLRLSDIAKMKSGLTIEDITRLYGSNEIGFNDNYSRVPMHNILLTILNLTGTIGGIIILWVIYKWFNTSWKAFSRHPNPDQVGVFLFCVTTFASAMYGEALFTESSGYLFWCSMGIHAALMVQARTERIAA